MPLTNDQIEERVARAIAEFHREQHGRAPGSCQAHLVGNLLLVQLHDTFTSIEQDLIGTEHGKKMVQSSRRDLRALTRRDIETRVGNAIGHHVQRSFYDLDVRNGMQIEVYVLDGNA
jgi:uncharacterized protein YbcI